MLVRVDGPSEGGEVCDEFVTTCELVPTYKTKIERKKKEDKTCDRNIRSAIAYAKVYLETIPSAAAAPRSSERMKTRT